MTLLKKGKMEFGCIDCGKEYVMFADATVEYGIEMGVIEKDKIHPSLAELKERLGVEGI